MKLNAALPADMRAAETGADAAPEREKKYVKPAMQVFPLGCQMLAASGVSEPPVVVQVNFAADVYIGITSAPCISALARLSLDDLVSANPFARLGDATYYYYPHGYRPCFSGHSGPAVVFGPGGESWSEGDFLANVQLDSYANRPLDIGGSDVECDGESISGTYNGRSVLVYYSLCMYGHD